MNNIIQINYQPSILDTHRVQVKDLINNKILLTENIPSKLLILYIETKTIKETANLVKKMIEARYQQYRHTDYAATDPKSWQKKMQIFDKLMILAAGLWNFKTIEEQTKYLQVKMYGYLEVIAPKSDHYKAFPALLNAIGQPALHSQLQIILE